MNGTRAGWTWRFVGDDAGPLPAAPVATSRFDAENWLGEHWRDLASAGVREATLMLGAEAVGRPVELREFTF